MNREKSVRVRLNEIEFEWLKQESERRDVPVSQVIRESLKKIMVKESEVA